MKLKLLIFLVCISSVVFADPRFDFLKTTPKRNSADFTLTKVLSKMNFYFTESIPTVIDPTPICVSSRMLGKFKIQSLSVDGGNNAYIDAVPNIINLQAGAIFQAGERIQVAFPALFEGSAFDPSTYRFYTRTNPSTAILGGFSHIPNPNYGVEATKEVNLTVQDFNANGVVDILFLTKNGTASNLPWWFGYNITSKDFTGNNTKLTNLMEFFETADFDADGYNDIFFVTSNTINVQRNTCGNSSSVSAVPDFALTSVLDITAASFSLSTALVSDFKIDDFNRDGLPDVFAVTNRKIEFFKNTSTPATLRFDSPTFLSIGSLDSNYHLKKIYIEDIDNDGALDILGLAQHPSTYSLTLVFLRGDGTGSCTFVGFVSTESTVPDLEKFSLCFLDFNGDDQLDIAFTGVSMGNTIECYTNLSTNASTNISFEKQITVPNGENADVNNRMMKVGDMNGDAVLDLVVGMQNAINPMILLNESSASSIASFTPSAPFLDRNTDFVGMIEVVDLDRDSDLDVVCVSAIAANGVKNYNIVPRYNLNLTQTVAATCLFGTALLSTSSYTTRKSSTLVNTPTYIWKDANANILNVNDTNTTDMWVSDVLTSTAFSVDIIENYAEVPYTLTLPILISAVKTMVTSSKLVVKNDYKACGSFGTADISNAILINTSSQAYPNYWKDVKLSSKLVYTGKVSDGVYFVSTLDDNQCKMVRRIIVKNFPIPPVKLIQADIAFCANKTYTFTAQGPDLALDEEYEWATSLAATKTEISSPIASDKTNVNFKIIGFASEIEVFTITLTDTQWYQNKAFSCSNEIVKTVTLNRTPPTPIIALDRYATDLSSSMTVFNLYTSYTFRVLNAQAMTSYDWTNAGNVLTASANFFSFRGTIQDYLPNQQYEISVRAIDADEKGAACPSEISNEFYYTYEAIPTPIITYNNTANKGVLCNSNSASIIVTANQDEELRYIWSYSNTLTDGWQSMSGQQSSQTITEAGSYKIELYRDFPDGIDVSPRELLFNIKQEDIHMNIPLSVVESVTGNVYSRTELEELFFETGSNLMITIADVYEQVKWYQTISGTLRSSTTKTLLVHPFESTIYTLVTTNAYSCIVTQTFKVKILQTEFASNASLFKKYLKSEYTAYSPDAAESPKLIFDIKDKYSLSKLSLVVIDRLGRIVYQSDDYQNDWNFTDKESSSFLMQGTYYYKLSFGDYQPVQSFFDIVR